MASFRILTACYLVAVAPLVLTGVPDTWDWRKEGAVGPVYDQGEIGNSLAFSVAEAVSGYHFIKTGKLIKTSVQELIDCDCVLHNKWRPPTKNSDVYSCIVGLDGLCRASDYPPAGQPEACLSNKCTPAANITGGYWVQPMNETDLKAAVYKNPAVVYVNAGQDSFQTYTSGVYSDPACDPKQIDHALLVVGYGSMNGQDVWYCKNSWGASWGDQGYIYILRNANTCGIATAASIPV